MFNFIKEYRAFKQWKHSFAAHNKARRFLLALNFADYTDDECILTVFKHKRIPGDYKDFIASILLCRTGRCSKEKETMSIQDALDKYVDNLSVYWGK